MRMLELHRILAKYTPEEQAVIFWWRFWGWPEKLTVTEIVFVTGLPEDVIRASIAKFNRELRMKLEVDQLKKDIMTACQDDFA